MRNWYLMYDGRNWYHPWRKWYLMYDDFAGVLIVSVEAIFKPVKDKTGNVNEDERWKGTMEY
jgi:hypothetical protein